MLKVEDIAEARRLARTGEAERIRQASCTSARENADSIGVSHTTYRRWETGQSMPRGEAAVRWLRHLRRLQELAA